MRPIAVIALLLIGGCLTVHLLPASPEQVTRARTRWPEVTPASLEEGRLFYGDRCSGCHALPDPQEHTAETWPPQVERMASVSHLTPHQSEVITRYLQTVALP